MNIGGGEAADQMVRMILSGSEIVIRLTGSAAKNLLAMSLALARNHKKLSGKMRMGKMLRETRDLRVFSMTQEEYRAFKSHAHGKGLLYAAVRNTGRSNTSDKMVDVIMPTTEVERANVVFRQMMYRQPKPPREEQIRQERQVEKKAETPKKDSRSEHASRDTNISSRTRTESISRTTSDERPSIEERLKCYRAQLNEQRQRVPARNKTKSRNRTPVK